MQLIKLIIYLFGFIIIACTLSNTSPWTILSGLGALTAILLLVFKDTILGLVASIQVFGSDTIREGDWVTIPSLDIDGDCIEVGLHTVTVRSWDKALITFPSAKLLEHPFKNWRGMEESGGRRIKRAINIDQESICFVEGSLKERLLKISHLEKHFEEKNKEIETANSRIIMDKINHRKLTNIGVFRAYLIEYLKTRNSSGHYSNESEFKGDTSYWCETAIKNEKMNIHGGELVGVKNNQGKIVLLENLMEEAYIHFHPNSYGIYIPADDILKRPKYQWFAVLSSEAVLNTNAIVSKHLMSSIADSEDMYHQDKEVRSVVTI